MQCCICRILDSGIASVVYITDKGDEDRRRTQTTVSQGFTHTQRRLHQFMYADRDTTLENMICWRTLERLNCQ
ncbi:hypothetical protein HanPI659440_Chr14g0550011 [Helianthus annuus]|nr:hypothetical protein HanPI659440_Chr14g0550011 [Helianthus annuus]